MNEVFTARQAQIKHGLHAAPVQSAAPKDSHLRARAQGIISKKTKGRMQMAQIQMEFLSRSLCRQCGMTLLLPQQARGGAGLFPKGRRQWPVLYLLHGMYNDHTSWTRQTSIERYAAALPLLIVMPDAENSFYTDIPGSVDRYWTFLSEELPEVIASCFPVSTAREDTFVAGLSMGGYGAMRLALKKPERYAAAACLSGPLDIPAALRTRGDQPDVVCSFQRVFGSVQQQIDEDLDPFCLAEKVRAEIAPRIYLSCGTGDSLLGMTRSFRARFRDKLDITYDEQPGAHEWAVWDAQIEKVLRWLPLSGT